VVTAPRSWAIGGDRYVNHRHRGDDVAQSRRESQEQHRNTGITWDNFDASRIPTSSPEVEDTTTWAVPVTKLPVNATVPESARFPYRALKAAESDQCYQALKLARRVMRHEEVVLGLSPVASVSLPEDVA
jgi:hypothetical protein